ncbi:XRE family transcriptional regulator [Bdellovibrio sp. HCB288]|uniref:XRE family transcriptional regulator n=1 Tax=Bdellovibrio sp. HCB288 TaxID=3394355 RepID=UPI0039B3E4D4
MKNEKLKPLTMEELAKEWGIDYQVFKIKSELVKTVKSHCIENKISQRKLAAMIPGLSQDRVSKIFSGQVGHMTIDKLVSILTVLNYSVAIKTKAA